VGAPATAFDSGFTETGDVPSGRFADLLAVELAADAPPPARDEDGLDLGDWLRASIPRSRRA
jgi:hypothetical protein